MNDEGIHPSYEVLDEVPRPKPYSKRELRDLRDRINAPRIIQLTAQPRGAKCEMCAMKHPLARFMAGWKTIYLCQAHLPYVDLIHPAAVVDDPRPEIQKYIDAMIIEVKDIGPVLEVEQYPHLGPCFVTEIRTAEGGFQIVCVAAKECNARGPVEFVIYRCRCILHGIRTLLGLPTEAPA